jgi:hypothetical protein
MSQIVQEGIEPLLIGTSLLQRIEFQTGMQTVFPAIEPLRAEEAGDGMDLPIYNINIGGAQSFGVQVQRHGLRLKIAKRFVDERAILLKQELAVSGRQRLARHKEGRCSPSARRRQDRLRQRHGSTLADGEFQPIKGVPTGRNCGTSSTAA